MRCHERLCKLGLSPEQISAIQEVLRHRGHSLYVRVLHRPSIDAAEKHDVLVFLGEAHTLGERVHAVGMKLVGAFKVAAVESIQVASLDFRARLGVKLLKLYRQMEAARSKGMRKMGFVNTVQDAQTHVLHLLETGYPFSEEDLRFLRKIALIAMKGIFSGLPLEISPSENEELDAFGARRDVHMIQNLNQWFREGKISSPLLVIAGRWHVFRFFREAPRWDDPTLVDRLLNDGTGFREVDLQLP